MPSVTFNQTDGRSTTLQIADGSTLMRAAIDNNVRGILGDCGGSCVCATCHVYLDDSFANAFPPPDEGEADLLECVVAERRPTSRLGCQLRLTPRHDGLVVQVPERQL